VSGNQTAEEQVGPGRVQAPVPATARVRQRAVVAVGRLVARKALALVPVLVAVSFLTFGATALLPGCVECQVVGIEGADAEVLAEVRADLRLGEPVVERYVAWLGDAVSGDLGRSYGTRQSVSGAIAERLPVTVELVALSMAVSLAVSIPLGIVTAYRAGGRLDRVVAGATFGVLATPTFVVALLLIYLFAIQWGWFPATGWTRLTADPVGNVRSALMPALALAAPNVAVFTRVLRADMLATLREDHVLLARAKGLPPWRVLVWHGLRPSAFSLLTVSGLAVGNLLGGAVIVEQLFALPGIGRLLFDAIFQRDLMMVQGVVLVVTVGFVVVNGLVDVLYVALDPRLRTAGGARG
jgi:peptide/nickel transport system permease protein